LGKKGRRKGNKRPREKWVVSLRSRPKKLFGAQESSASDEDKSWFPKTPKTNKHPKENLQNGGGNDRRKSTKH